ncbi:chemotaxis protein CheW [Pseudomonas sp. NCCP-436]|uniref:chemotaxis protein CheW n=1 Tax=Pseudomonas sp. NCCP-436 TaxID=2842481 RepID=UPI001C807C06|nr:chemotaxis protein CheW [Pseudomonas sp. NCCP-436]GIZ12897.1 chemotaxis protein CheW [Pseudomonas sp. NCCP-436]
MPATRKTQSGELHLQFRLGPDRYALPASAVVEVLPRRPLKQLPEAPEWVAGLFEHRGRMIPVIDLPCRLLGQAARSRSSTRLVLVRFDARLGENSPVLGLLLEQATETLRLHPEQFVANGLEAVLPNYLGPVQKSAQGVIQRIEVDQLLDDALRAMLFRAGKD